MRRQQRKSLRTVIAFAAIISSIVVGFTIYIQSLDRSLVSYANNNLSELLNQQVNSFDTLIHERYEMIRAIAEIFVSSKALEGGKDRAVVLRALEETNKDSGFMELVLAGPEGEALTSGNHVVDVSEEEFFIRAKEGQTYLSEQETFNQNEMPVVCFSTPVYFNGEIAAVLIGVYDTREFEKVLTGFYEGAGYSYIYNPAGACLAATAGVGAEQDVLAVENGAVFEERHTLNDIKERLSHGERGTSAYTMNGQTRILSYAPLGVNNWAIFTSVSDAAVSQEIMTASYQALILIGFILLVIIGILTFSFLKQKKYADKLYKAAYVDKMTGAPNLEKFKLDVREILKKNGDMQFFIIKFDIYHFKMINEMYGIKTGDAVIKEIIRIMRQMTQKPNCVSARVNADEFIVLDYFEKQTEIEDNRKLFEKEFEKSGVVSGEHKIRFRYGRYVLQKGETDVALILEKVNMAHRMAREQKQDSMFDYDDDIKKRLIWETELENRTEEALANGEFIVYLQPKYYLSSEEIAGAEALVRWQCDGQTVAYPNQFIPLFEKTGFILKLDMYMLEQVCILFRKWIDTSKPLVPISINFSRLHLEQDNFVPLIEEMVTRYGISKKYIEIELTESTMLDNEEVLQGVLTQLHEAGFTLSMDDFGSGYSSLGLLKNLPVDVIKIDRGFFVNSRYKIRAKTVIESIMQMAKKLDINTVAEGVEEQEHIDLLREVGCDIVQGFYYARPVPASMFDPGNAVYVPDERQLEVPLEYATLGDLTLGRDEIEKTMPVAVYRLFLYALRGVLKDCFGEGEMVNIMRGTGLIAGRIFAKEMLTEGLPFEAFIAHLADKLLEWKIGRLQIEKFDQKTGKGTLAISEDFDCWGIANFNKTFCQYDEGFIAGILYEYTQKSYSVAEIECRETGVQVCRFEIKPK